MITIDEFYRLAADGSLASDGRVELLDGEIVEMAPIGHRHGYCLALLEEQFVLALRKRALVWNQTDVPLNLYSAPQPDLALLRRKSYADERPGPPDVLLVVEVADSSVAFDRKRKVPMYLAAGIPEVWLVDLNKHVIEVYLPGESVRIARAGDTLTPRAFPDIVIEVSEVSV